MTDIEQTMTTNCRDEVVDLHRFFEAWFNGTIEGNDENYSRLERVLGDGFVLISPDGRQTGRESLLSGLRGAYGSHEGDVPVFRIWIKNAVYRPVATGVGLVTYEEWQDSGGKTTVRLSSVLFKHKEDLPNEVEWLHVHETWLPVK